MPLSLNVSPSQFRQPDFVDSVRATLAETGAPPSQLIFEITESLLIDQLDATIGRMHELADMGIRFSIDDFGTGYSSFAYLQRMPLYELKIDKSFIRDIPDDANGKAIAQSILAMAGHLGLRVVAEGVETQAQAQFLAGHGAPHMQGYLFARPLPLPDMIALLDAGLANRPAVPPARLDAIL
jgi:EAL domain-containing protein (putative c-di-GMP-specific phosphodiesterase class I)